MLDGLMRRLINPPLSHMGIWVAKRGVTANTVTVLAFTLGLTAAVAIAFKAFLWGAVLILLSRLADGLDGAVARVSRPTDMGGFLDITFDFFFYGAVPLAFSIAAPDANALPAAVLLASFYANGASFLSFAIIAEKRKFTTTTRGPKSFYFISGLAEGTETIIVFILFCLFPQWFGLIAYIFAGICLLTAASRVTVGCLTFKDR